MQGLIVVNSEGIPIKTTLDNSTTVQYAGLLHQLTSKARSVVRDIDPQNDLTFLRIRSKKHEIMVAPGNLTRFDWKKTFIWSTIFFYLFKNRQGIFINCDSKFRFKSSRIELKSMSTNIQQELFWTFEFHFLIQTLFKLNELNKKTNALSLCQQTNNLEAKSYFLY